MGNVHSVVQIAPIVSGEGAALRVRRGSVAGFEARVRAMTLPKYVVIHRHVPSFTIANVNVDSTQVTDDDRTLVYLVINGGGKWGYNDDLTDFLRALAPLLDDATFFLSDEYTAAIDEYAIARNTLTITNRVAQNGSILDYVQNLVAKDPAKAYRYAMQQAEVWLDLSEPDGGLPWADRAIAARPHAWDAHYLRARVIGAQAGHAAAIEQLEKARACLGAYELERWGSDDDPLHNVKNDPDETIAHALQLLDCAVGNHLVGLGRVDEAFAAFDRSWSITPRRTNTAPMIAKAVALVERARFAEAEACLVKAMSIAESRHTIGTITYNRACIAARTGDTQRALFGLASAIELVTSYKVMAREDEDFATLRDLPELRALLA